MPKVSIILPCYNVEKYLARSIESALAQTYVDFELLVIIDGSPDNSKSIAEQYAQQDDRVKVFEKENGGLSDARNFGLERAKGEFIYFMDSDDWIEPNLLKDNIKIIEEENLDLVIFGYIQDDEDQEGKVILSTYVLPKLTKLVKGDTNNNIDSHHLGLLGYAWNKIYRKSFLDQHQLQFEKGTSLVEDILFNSQVYQSTSILRFNRKGYYHYLNRPVVTLMKKYYENSLELIVSRANALTNFLLKWGFSETKINEVVAISYFQGIRYTINNLLNSEDYNSERLRKILKHTLTKKLIKFYRPTNLKDKIYKVLIKNEFIRLILIMKRYK